MRPETWYKLYWTVMGLCVMAVNYFAMRHAVKWAIVSAAIQLGWAQ